MKRALAVLFLFLAAACTSDEKPIASDESTQQQKPAAPPPPSAQQARDLIANAPEFGEYEFTNASFTTPVSGVAMNEPSRQAVRELAAGGWLLLENTGDIALTEKSRNDKRFILRPNGLLDIVPLGKKEMGAVRNVSAQPDGSAIVDFTWRWIPNEVGLAFKTGPVADRFTTEQDGRATLMWDGTRWSVLSIE